ncbi:hypothetical protein [Mailhella massiliensis]|uniref:hypothetical protein n=1 Tax=Mailhella massiliensis TaxID=1903261 RepID=UPI00118684D1|nr:hypothetical protein [Mailhella massiliensis]
MPLIRGGVALCNFSFPLSTTFFKVSFQRSAFGVDSFEPLCLSAFLSYARFTPSCQTLFLYFLKEFSGYIYNYLIKFNLSIKYFIFPFVPISAFKPLFRLSERKKVRRKKIAGEKNGSSRRRYVFSYDRMTATQ